MDIILAFLLVVFVLLFIARSFSRSFRFVKFIVLNCILGLLLLISTNLIGTFFGFTLGVNVITILIAGFAAFQG